ncbi:MAG: hypothetical protein IAE84_13430 [Saprospiraceae bacterium]|nr:hypothetical protein [Saprospiraceae bacterium]
MKTRMSGLSSTNSRVFSALSSGVPDSVGKEGGRLICVVGGGGAGRACVFTKVAGQPSERIAFNAAVPPLPGFEAAPRFVF